MNTVRVIKRHTSASAEEPKSPVVTTEKKRKDQLARTVSDKLAESIVYHLSWKWPESAQDFPDEPWMRHVKKHYPYAKGGALLVDEPVNEGEVHACERKRRVLEKHGYRYITLVAGKTENDAREELSKWRGPQS